MPKRSIVAPVCLPWLENDHGRALEENDGVLVSGWGQVTNLKKSKDEAQRTLRKESLKIADNNDCVGIQDNQICAASKRQSEFLKVSLLGVDSLWGDCTFILADWGS